MVDRSRQAGAQGIDTIEGERDLMARYGRLTEKVAPAEIEGVIYREVNPYMIEAGMEVLAETTARVNSGDIPAADFVARIFGAMRVVQMRMRSIAAEPERSGQRPS